MNEEPTIVKPVKRGRGRPKSKRPQREMVSVPGEIAPAVRELVKAFRVATNQPD